MQRQFSDTIPANTYGKKGREWWGGGWRGLRTYVHLHGVLKCIAISFFVPVSLDDFILLLKAKDRV